MAINIDMLNDSAYKQITVSRGLDYRYFYQNPTDPSKPTLLFLHGFPSTSYDWRIQAAFFGNEGYGLIIPDMLGYGGTAKPSEVAAYKPTLICKDMIDILDAESISRCIAIGHDWLAQIKSVVICVSPTIPFQGNKDHCSIVQLLPGSLHCLRFLGCIIPATVSSVQYGGNTCRDQENVWLRAIWLLEILLGR